jgi:hypothetical protein
VEKSLPGGTGFEAGKELGRTRKIHRAKRQKQIGDVKVGRVRMLVIGSSFIEGRICRDRWNQLDHSHPARQLVSQRADNSYKNLYMSHLGDMYTCPVVSLSGVIGHTDGNRTGRHWGAGYAFAAMTPPFYGDESLALFHDESAVACEHK